MEIKASAQEDFTVKIGSETFFLRIPTMRDQIKLDKSLKAAKNGEVLEAEALLLWMAGLARDPQKFGDVIANLPVDGFSELATKIVDHIQKKRSPQPS